MFFRDQKLHLQQKYLLWHHFCLHPTPVWQLPGSAVVVGHEQHSFIFLFIKHKSGDYKSTIEPPRRWHMYGSSKSKDLTEYKLFLLVQEVLKDINKINKI